MPLNDPLNGYALFKDGQKMSKSHKSKYSAWIEAFDHKAIVSWGVDFAGDKPGIGLADGYEIKEVTL